MTYHEASLKALQGCFAYLCHELDLCDPVQDREEIANLQRLITEIQTAYNLRGGGTDE